MTADREIEQGNRGVKLQELHAALARGIADAEAGRTMPIDEAFKTLRLTLDIPENRTDTCP